MYVLFFYLYTSINYPQKTNNMKNLYILSIAILFLASCGQSVDKMQKVDIDGKFTVEVPEVMTKTTGLNDDACLEYQNTLKEYYMIVIDDDIKEFNEVFVESGLNEYYDDGFIGYADFIYESFVEALTVYTDADWKEFTVNNMAARQKEVDAELDGIKVYYTYTLVHGKDYYYQILMWTLPESKEDFKKIVDKTIASFKEVY